MEYPEIFRIKIILFFITNLFLHQLHAQDTTGCLTSAMRMYEAADYPDAYEKFSSCSKDIPDKNSDAYNICLMYMGICKLENSEYKHASSLLHEVENAFSPGTYNYFIYRQTRAALAKRSGNYGEAETILLDVLAMQQRMPDTDCALKAITLNDLGVIYKRLGQYDRSITYLSESLTLKQSCLDPEDASVTISLNNLAGVYMKQKDYIRADSLYTSNIKIKTRQWGPNHPSTLIARNNLAELYRQQGDYPAALSILLDVRTRKAATIGKHTLSYATTLYTIANVYYASGNYHQSLTYCRAALSIKENILGKKAPGTTHSYVLLAKNLHALNKNIKAQSVYAVILKTKQEEIDTYFKYLGEEEKIQYVKANTAHWKDFTNFVFDMDADSTNRSASKKILLNQWIEYRWYISEIILEETQRQHRLWESISDTAQRRTVEELKFLKDEVARLYLLKSKEDGKSTAELTALTERAAQVEKQLTGTFHTDARRKYSVPAITAALDVSECIVEIVKPLQTTGRYLALIYLKGLSTPYKIWLAEGNVLDGKGYAYYKNTIQFKLEDKKSAALYWQQIADFISGYDRIQTIYLVRDGIYECMNLHTLLPDTGKTYKLIYFNKAENILSYKQQAKAISINKTAFIYHPLYGNTSAECIYTDLPGTKSEVDSIESIFRKNSLPTVRYGEQLATETTVKDDTCGYSILHIATHGYLDAGTDRDYVDAMIHSGLLLSGVCDMPDLQSHVTDDGILTSYEIAQLQLSKTELVVLSACQSGLGVIDNQEGLLGLQRGLLVAGAKKVLLSLWKIDDAITAEWMYYFYSRLLETRSCYDAYLFAQQKIKARYHAPYYWAAFVLLEQ